jgi:hypothetical protein
MPETVSEFPICYRNKSENRDEDVARIQKITSTLSN